MSRSGAADTFWALSDPLRIDLLDRIAASDNVTVTELAAELPLTRQAISRHLRTLESASLLRGSRSGRERCYCVNTEPLVEANLWLDRRRESWGRALDRLAAHVEQGEE